MVRMVVVYWFINIDGMMIIISIYNFLFNLCVFWYIKEVGWLIDEFLGFGVIKFWWVYFWF